MTSRHQEPANTTNVPTVASIIGDWLTTSGMTRELAAQQLGVSRQGLFHYHSGRSVPSPAIRKRLAHAAGVPLPVIERACLDAMGQRLQVRLSDEAVTAGLGDYTLGTRIDMPFRHRFPNVERPGQSDVGDVRTTSPLVKATRVVGERLADGWSKLATSRLIHALELEVAARVGQDDAPADQLAAICGALRVLVGADRARIDRLVDGIDLLLQSC